MDNFEYDPEKALWKPGRRAFFFLAGSAMLAPMLPEFGNTPKLVRVADLRIIQAAHVAIAARGPRYRETMPDFQMSERDNIYEIRASKDGILHSVWRLES